MDAACAVSAACAPAMRLRTVSPVTCSSRRARSANAAAPIVTIARDGLTIPEIGAQLFLSARSGGCIGVWMMPGETALTRMPARRTRPRATWSPRPGHPWSAR